MLCCMRCVYVGVSWCVVCSYVYVNVCDVCVCAQVVIVMWW